MPTPLTTCLLVVAAVATTVSGPAAIGIAAFATVWQAAVQASETI